MFVKADTVYNLENIPMPGDKVIDSNLHISLRYNGKGKIELSDCYARVEFSNGSGCVMPLTNKPKLYIKNEVYKLLYKVWVGSNKINKLKNKHEDRIYETGNVYFDVPYANGRLTVSLDNINKDCAHLWSKCVGIDLENNK